ncbi:hypothetical protein ACFSSA_09300 [Luteolibacter algae]|uniref:Uncharacterized protein n=1 Tax=Luteolibacter algae TaxID=454151 RepID=A0ABW5D805_9BACT
MNTRKETPIDETEDDLCRALWIAVAIQAIIDASSKSRKKSAIKERSRALQWLSDNSDEESDLAWVCDLAGIDFRELRKRFKKSLRNPDESIDFRCLKKAGIENRGTESRKRYFARARKNARIRQERTATQTEADKQVRVISPYCELKDAPQLKAKRAS